MTQELWQLYDTQGRPLAGQGATKDEVLTKGLLHAAAHIWFWRHGARGPEVLLQKRAAIKRTWPNRYDISAAGHIDLGEEPLQAALRETQEELGLDIAEADLQYIGTFGAHMRTDAGDIENEFEWLYLLHAPQDLKATALQETEVAAVSWKPLTVLRAETSQPDTSQYVPHGSTYFQYVADAIQRAAETEQT